MRERTLLLYAAAAVGIAGLSLIAATGQSGVPAKKATTAAIPRLADGHPDLQGTYDLATLTPVERRAGMPLVLSDTEAARLEQEVAQRTDALAAPIKGDRDAPPKGGDGSPGPYGNVGGYNNFWLEPGSHYTVLDGQPRASLVIDPPDGRVPALTPGARQRRSTSDYSPRPTSDQAAREDDPGFEGPTAYDDPEIRPLAERCLLGFSSTSGPPILPTYFYNNLHQIVQSPDSVMILTEMVHDARIIRMNAQHAPKNVRKWLGDSVGHWDGDTLVVDTTNFTDRTRFRGSTDNLHVIERLIRMDARTLRYQFTIDDPATWTKPWTGEYAWPMTDSRIYEYACHEGNYALGNILRGARQKERDERGKN
ncbi:MAG: hypothetical protein DMF98_20860 [Acidobacteria bacterium]|nr:MAG: hypothetical protein DMF98_20860 [Acidobacteriota bacterium]